jgi:hypothetical protein
MIAHPSSKSIYSYWVAEYDDVGDQRPSRQMAVLVVSKHKSRSPDTHRMMPTLGIATPLLSEHRPYSSLDI